MAKIPFTLEAWLKDKSQKVIDNKGNELVVCSFEFTSKEPYIHAYEKKNGCGRKGYKLDEVFFRLEPELTEFEKTIKDLVLDIEEGELQALGVFEEENLGAWAVKKARELLDLARKEFVKQGYVIEKKAFHDAVEKIDDKCKAEMSVQYSLHCKVENGTRHAVMNWNEFEKVAQLFFDRGKAEALKDLPRWEESACVAKIPHALIKTWHGECRIGSGVEPGDKYITLGMLEKLPGFKED